MLRAVVEMYLGDTRCIGRVRFEKLEARAALRGRARGRLTVGRRRPHRLRENGWGGKVAARGVPTASSISLCVVTLGVTKRS